MISQGDLYTVGDDVAVPDGHSDDDLMTGRPQKSFDYLHEEKVGGGAARI